MAQQLSFGGFRPQSVDPAQQSVPDIVLRNQLAGTVEGYREAVLAAGIPLRADGLFPPDEPFICELLAAGDVLPFEKHLAGLRSPYELPAQGSWVSGNAACQNGFDLRLFYRRRQEGQAYGTLVGAARLGDRASIGNGYWMTAHGGSIESLLDESTAELAKMEFSPVLSTIEAAFQLRKPLPLHTTVRIDCQVTKVAGVRCWVSGTISLPGPGTLLATCEAQLVDLRPILALQRMPRQPGWGGES